MLDRSSASEDVSSVLLAALARLRKDVSALSLVLDVPGVASMRQERDAVLRLLDGYNVGRLREERRPLLVVIGGPTGSGKSTLLNSLMGKQVTQVGVLRPTTVTPVLLHHPDNVEVARRLLPGLVATTSGGANPVAGAPAESATVRLVADDGVAPGLLLLDSPDLDSWMRTNRDLAARMLEVADLWLFVTTGTDYADGVPWELLRSAVQRKVSVAAVINRLRPKESDFVPKHFAAMLVAEGLTDAPILRVPEVDLVEDRIPYSHVLPMHTWLTRQSEERGLRKVYVERATEGSIDQVIANVQRLIEAVADQVVTDRRLRGDLRLLFDLACSGAAEQLAGGRACEGTRAAWREVARWTAARSGPRRLRRALAEAMVVPADPHLTVTEALKAEIAQLTSGLAATALGRVMERWANDPAASSVDLASIGGLSDTFQARAVAAVVEWLDEIQDQVTGDGSVAGPQPLTLAVATLALAGDLVADVVPDRSVEASPAAYAASLTAGLDLAALLPRVQELLLARLTVLMGSEHDRLAALLDAAQVSSVIGAELQLDLLQLQQLRSEAFGAVRMTAVPAG